MLEGTIIVLIPLPEAACTAMLTLTRVSAASLHSEAMLLYQYVSRAFCMLESLTFFYLLTSCLYKCPFVCDAVVTVVYTQQQNV